MSKDTNFLKGLKDIRDLSSCLLLKSYSRPLLKIVKEGFNEEGGSVMGFGVGRGKREEFSSGYNKEKWAFIATWGEEGRKMETY